MDKVKELVYATKRLERLKEIQERLERHAVVLKPHNHESVTFAVDSPYGASANFSYKGGVLSEEAVARIFAVVVNEINHELQEVTDQLETANQILGGK